MSFRHAVVNPNNKVINVIIWDGVSRYNPPQDHILVRHDFCDIGDVYIPDENYFIKHYTLNSSPELEGE